MPARFTWSGIRRGFTMGQPLAPAVLALALTFGVLARESGLSLLEASLMSVAVFSGSAQVATVNLQLTATGVAAAVVTILMLNARYLLYGAAMRPWLGQLPASRAYLSLFFLGDASWALSMRAYADGETDAGFVLGSGVSTFLPWIGGTLAGSVASAWLQSPQRYGLDFLLTAFCAAMAVGMVRPGLRWQPYACALLVAAVVDRLLPGGWTIVAAGLAGAVCAMLIHRDRDEPAT